MDIAGARMNFWVIHHALTMRPALAKLCERQDNHGFTPLTALMDIIYKHVPPVKPPAKDAESAAAMRYEVFHDFETPKPGCAAPPFADVDVFVEDDAMGPVRLVAHRSVLAKASKTWHAWLRQQGSGHMVLKINPQCCRSARVITEALHFIYTGEFAGELGREGHLLAQLLSLCVTCRLCKPLRRHTIEALLRSLDDAENIAVLPVLMRGARYCGLNAVERRYVATVFLGHPAVLRNLSDDLRALEKMAVTIRGAIEELEGHVMETLKS